MGKITISCEGMNITIDDKPRSGKVNKSNNEKISSESFFNDNLIKTCLDDRYKLLTKICQIIEEINSSYINDANKIFLKSNFEMSKIDFMSSKDCVDYKDDETLLDYELFEIEVYEVDENKQIPNGKTVLKYLDDYIISKINALLGSSGFKSRMKLITGTDYPIDLKSEYRGHTVGVCVDLKSNKDELKSLEKNFNKFVGLKIKSLIGTIIQSKTKIVKIASNNYIEGLTIIVNQIDDIESNYNSMYELEKKINNLIKNNPLSDKYNVKYIEDGYWRNELHFNINITNK